MRKTCILVMVALLEAATCLPSAAQYVPVHLSNDGIYLFLDELASENLLEAVALLRPRHLPMCVAIRESEWDDLIKCPPSNLQEVYERSVLQESLRQRSRAMRGLLQKGALAMDLPPAKLSLGTFERYLEVKQRGLL